MVENDGLQRGTEADFTGIGLQLAGQQLEQGGFPRAVRPDNPHPIPAQNAGGEVFDNRAAIEADRHVFRHRHQLAGDIGLLADKPRTAQRAVALAGFLPQVMQTGEAFDVALAARGDAIAQPILFHHQLAAELVAVAFFLFEHLVAPRLEMGKTAFDPSRRAAIEPDDGA